MVSNATSCLEVSTFIYPYTAYEDSYIHSAFENAAAMTGGVETAYKVLKKKGKIDETYKFICFGGGDGGTYDIGFQSLSGAMERGHDMVYVCYDNEAYMNTGIQRLPRRRVCRCDDDACGQRILRQSAEQKESDGNYGGTISLCCPDHLLGDFRDLAYQISQGDLPEGPCFPQRALTMPPRLALRDGGSG